MTNGLKKPSILTGLLVALFLTLPLTAILFLVHILIGTPFPAFDVFDLSARILPGGLIEFGKTTIISLIRTFQLGRTDTSAKTIEQLMGAMMFITAGVLISTVIFAIWRGRIAASADTRAESRRLGMVSAVIFGVPMLLITAGINFAASASPIISLIWLIIAYVLWGVAHAEVYARLFGPALRPAMPASPAGISIPAPVAAEASADSVRVINRRQFIVQLGGVAATVTVLGTGLGAILDGSRNGSVRSGASGSNTSTTPSPDLPNAGDVLVAAPGTRPEYTPLDQYYRIDISSSGAPAIDIDRYRLPFKGLVENPTELSLSQIRNLPSMKQYITTSCISNSVAGDLIGTTLWTGVSMQKLLEMVRPKPEAKFIRITGADGFFETVSIDLIRKDERLMLAYDWDNQPLPPLHGAPLRIHVPDLYGMKQPKWITGMEFIAEDDPGFWVVRGWDAVARVRATSVIDTVAVNAPVTNGDKKLIPIGGIAWAGARCISKVEVKVDDGDWVAANLRKPLSDKTWAIWRYDWPFEAGNHRFTVRCTEKDGTAQITREADVAPSGATGLHSVNQRL